jgi:NAD(P)-dependent dehydrogenase (short-subunit alcohol dehydrogenase family)
VLVTGCSSGIGLATARVLQQRGWEVVPTARSDGDLAMLRADGFRPVRLDVADSGSVAACATEALEILGGAIGGLVNNAGLGVPGPLEEIPREALRRQFEVNVFGAQDLANRLIPVMRAQGWGRIVNVSSVLGRIVTPMTGAYCASKFALEALSDALRVELWDSGIGVSIVEPGPIVSEFRRNAAATAEAVLDVAGSRYADHLRGEIDRRKKQEKKPDGFTLGPEAVAAPIAHALESARPRRRYCVTIAAHLGAFAARFAPPALLDWANRRGLPGEGS